MFKQKLDKKLWTGILISLFFLFLLFRKIDIIAILAAFREMDFRYLCLAVAATFVSYFLRAIRWRFLILPIKKTSMGNLFSATIIGYMANNLLPARLGEFVRAYVLGVREGIGTSAVFATLVLDRLLDGFTVLLILLITFFAVTLSPGMEGFQKSLVVGGYVTLLLYIAIILFLLLLKRNTLSTLKFTRWLLIPFPSGGANKVVSLIGSFIQGLRLSSRPGELLALLLSSLLIWTFAVWSVDLSLRSFGIVLPVTASMFIMVFLVFAVMVPASPGYVGTYHAACVYALMAFSIQKEKALSVALVIHGVSFFPVILAGFYCLWHEKLSLADLRKRSFRQRSSGV